MFKSDYLFLNALRDFLGLKPLRGGGVVSGKPSTFDERLDYVDVVHARAGRGRE